MLPPEEVAAIFVEAIQGAAGRSMTSRDINRKIHAFKHDPKQNVPKIRPSGAPAGPSDLERDGYSLDIFEASCFGAKRHPLAASVFDLLNH
jgi:hypothetical protein